jgi:two-component system, LuxR family, sensor kinase FixL
VTSLIQDVTAARREEADRQRSAAALSASELRYRRLFEAAQDGVLILDGETGQITDANPFLSTLLGYSRQELLSKKLWDLGLPSDRTANLAAFQLLQTEGYVRHENLPLVTQAGQPIEVEFVGSVHLTGIKRVAQCNIRDVSDRKRLEADRRQFNLQLELSNRELQDFAFVASHDLQEPLRKIQAFGDRLRLKCADVLSDEGQDYLTRIQNAAKRMQTLIDDLLSFSRITTKAQPFVSIKLADIVQEVLSDLEVRIQEAGGRVEVGDLPILEADPMQMRQLLQNLISNALKFHQPETTPLIRVQSQALAQDGDRYCQITVADNGIGFDEKYLDRIFTVFQRLHGRNEYEGTGVGLAICRKIVERHGGLITATSQPGAGATFFVTLPLHQK